jgi:acetylornithine/succinyldiaminopimelate/putrescine aminotransferase
MGEFIAAEVADWKLPAITAVRAFGFMIGFELNTDLIEAREDFKASGKVPSIWITQQLMNAGLLVVPAGPKVLRWLPPMNTTEAEADKMTYRENADGTRSIASITPRGQKFTLVLAEPAGSVAKQ